MNTWPHTLQAAIVFFSNDENSQRFMIAIRWAEWLPGVEKGWMATSPKPAHDSSFVKFQAFMGELVQVPKAELDRKLTREQNRKSKKKK